MSLTHCLVSDGIVQTDGITCLNDRLVECYFSRLSVVAIFYVRISVLIELCVEIIVQIFS